MQMKRVSIDSEEPQVVELAHLCGRPNLDARRGIEKCSFHADSCFEVPQRNGTVELFRSKNIKSKDCVVSI